MKSRTHASIARLTPYTRAAVPTNDALDVGQPNARSVQVHRYGSGAALHFVDQFGAARLEFRVKECFYIPWYDLGRAS